MNRSLRHVAVAAFVMFAALLVNSNLVQVGEASSLRANPHNVRVLYGEYSHQRGPIVAGGKDVARSVKTHDSLKYLRTYPGGPAYAPVTGYYSLVYQASGIETTMRSGWSWPRTTAGARRRTHAAATRSGASAGGAAKRSGTRTSCVGPV